MVSQVQYPSPVAVDAAITSPALRSAGVRSWREKTLHIQRLDQGQQVGIAARRVTMSATVASCRRSNLEPMGPPGDGYCQLMRMGMIHLIPVPLTESHDQRRCWLAWRSAVHL